MSWFSKPKKAAYPLAIDEPISDPEEQLVALLREYEKYFYEKVKGIESNEVEEAQKIVTAASKFVSESRLGYALARPLLSHVRHWPAWSKRADFDKYANGPFNYIDGSKSDSNPKTTIVSFSYHETLYTLKFVDKGMLQWADDMNAYGKVELIKDKTIVLGLDIVEDLGKGDASYWAMSGLYAFQPGLWIKELIEMGAYIDGMWERQMNEFKRNDILERAKRIKLPD